MDNLIFDESNGLWYELQDGYYFPYLTVLEEKKYPIGIWGRKHERYLREHRQIVYNSLLWSGKLSNYLVDIDLRARNRYKLVFKQLKHSRGITEELKAADFLAWVGRMNNAGACAREIVNAEIIYA